MGRLEREREYERKESVQIGVKRESDEGRRGKGRNVKEGKKEKKSYQCSLFFSHTYFLFSFPFLSLPV